MNKLKLLLLTSVGLLPLHLVGQKEKKEKKVIVNEIAYHNLGITFDASLLRLTGTFDYRFNVKKMTFLFRYSYGQIGKKKFVDFSKQDAYSGIYNFPGYNGGGYWPSGFQHNFVGHSIGIGGGRNFFIGSKSSIALTLNFDLLLLEDRFLLLYADQNNKEKRIKRTTFDVALDIDYYYKLSDLISMNFGIAVPLVFPYFKDPGMFGFQPVGNHIPALGFEPYLKAGIQFNIRKNKSVNHE